jgi:hypothetical protein
MLSARCRTARALAVTLFLILPAPVLAQALPPAPAQLPARDPVLPQSAFPDMPLAPPPPPADWPPPPPPPPAPPADGGMLASPFAGAPWASPVVGHVPYTASYRITWLPDEQVQVQPAKLGVVDQDASVRFPLWQTDTDELSGNARVRWQAIHTGGAILPNTDQPFPDNLWDIRFGASYRHLFENGWLAGGNVSFGSASNEPFHSVNELTVGVNAFLRLPWGERDAWLFSLSYSPTAELAFPIPGVSYLWVPSDQLRMNIGLPFMVMYRPIDELTLDFSYMLLTTIHARATYRICPQLRAYLGFDWSNESWFIVPRPDDKDRLFYYEKRLSVGAQTNLGRTFLLDLSTGWVFDRYYFEGQHQSDSGFNRVNVNDAPLLSFQAQLRW